MSKIRANFYHQCHLPRHLHPTPSDHYITIPNMSSANKFRFNKHCVCRKPECFFVQTQLCELVTPATTEGDEPSISAASCDRRMVPIKNQWGRLLCSNVFFVLLCCSCCCNPCCLVVVLFMLLSSLLLSVLLCLLWLIGGCSTGAISG
jgi:hypothetical protein